MLTKLRAVRKQRGLTQETMARLLGVKRTTYTSWERGLRRVRSDMMLRIAIALGVPAEELFGELVSHPRRGEEDAAP